MIYYNVILYYHNSIIYYDVLFYYKTRRHNSRNVVLNLFMPRRAKYKYKS